MPESVSQREDLILSHLESALSIRATTLYKTRLTRLSSSFKCGNGNDPRELLDLAGLPPATLYDDVMPLCQHHF